MPQTVITYGTFDMFHIGHLNLLRRLADMADKVIVAVSTDEFTEQKGKKVLIPYEQRAAIVSAIRYVDLVIPETDWKQKTIDIINHKVDIFAIGDDWHGEFDFLKTQCKVIYLPRTRNISTTTLKNSLKTSSLIPWDDLKQAFEVIESLKKDLE